MAYAGEILACLDDALRKIQGIKFEEKLVLIDNDGSWAMDMLRDQFDGEFDINNADISVVLRFLKMKETGYGQLIIGQHGNASGVYIGKDVITLDNFDQYKDTLKEMGRYVHDRLILIECEAGGNEELMRLLAETLNIEVVASNTKISSYNMKNSFPADLWRKDWVIVQPNGDLDYRKKYKIPVG